MLLTLLSMLSNEADRRKLWELYHQYGNAMLRAAERYFPQDSRLAEDAVQNAWIKVIQNFSKIHEIPCKKTGFWLVCIVKNESITLLRKQHAPAPLKEQDARSGEMDDCLTRQTVLEVIRSMPETYRQVLELRFAEEWSPGEIARFLGLTETAVKTRVSRGRALLIQKLKEEGITP